MLIQLERVVVVQRKEHLKKPRSGKSTDRYYIDLTKREHKKTTQKTKLVLVQHAEFDF